MKVLIKHARLVVALVMTATGASMLHAADPQDSAEKSMMDRGSSMMGMMRGMMGMMSGNTGMMSSCPMMRQNNDPDGRTARPNDQWREKPSASRKDGS